MQSAVDSKARGRSAKAAVLPCFSRFFNTTTTYLLKKGSMSFDLADTWFFGGLRNEPDEWRINSVCNKQLRTALGRRFGKDIIGTQEISHGNEAQSSNVSIISCFMELFRRCIITWKSFCTFWGEKDIYKYIITEDSPICLPTGLFCQSITSLGEVCTIFRIFEIS